MAPRAIVGHFVSFLRFRWLTVGFWVAAVPGREKACTLKSMARSVDGWDGASVHTITCTFENAVEAHIFVCEANFHSFEQATARRSPLPHAIGLSFIPIRPCSYHLTISSYFIVLDGITHPALFDSKFCSNGFKGGCDSLRVGKNRLECVTPAWAKMENGLGCERAQPRGEPLGGQLIECGVKCTNC